MKLSTTFVLIAAALGTGSADAAEIIKGNLRANVFVDGINEDPAPSANPADELAAISVQEEPAPADDPAEVELEECVSQCSVLKRPSKRKVPTTSESDIAMGLKGCIDVCYENDDATVKNRLMNAVPKDVALSCAETAAEKYKEVGKKCSTMKSIKCKSCGSCKDEGDPDKLKSCEKKLKSCEKEYDACTACASEAKKARDSVKKVAKELDKCFAGVEDTEAAVEIA